MFPEIAALVPYAAISIGLLVFHNAWVAIFAYHICIVVVLALSKPKYPVRSSLPAWENLLMPLVFGFSGGVLLFLLWPLFNVPSGINSYLRNLGLTAAVWPWFIGYYVVVNPWLEEYFWRGCVASGEKRLLAADLMFAGYHVIMLAGNMGIIWVLAAFAILTLASWYWRQISRESGSLLIPVLSHTAADLSVIVAIYLLAGRLTY